jgi:hypothetical protein
LSKTQKRIAAAKIKFSGDQQQNTLEGSLQGGSLQETRLHELKKIATA